MPAAPSFNVYGATPPASPVVLSVPHAGRDYPLALRTALRVPVAALKPLEDRHVDALASAARGTETMLVQRTARAWIDLNRAEHERDPEIDDGADRQTAPFSSAKLRGGLGLVPRRVIGAGEIWRRRLDGDEVAARIAQAHRPYHAALASTLVATQARFGVAILLDIHSMPSLEGTRGAAVVIGDRFGRAAAARLVLRLQAEVGAAGCRCALNDPYAGGHILDVHGRPARGIHAVQIEFDRAAYLDAALDRPGKGIAAMAQLLRRMIDVAADEAATLAGSKSIAIAAE